MKWLDGFRAEFVAAGGEATIVSDLPNELDRRLEALIERGRAAHAALELDDETFVAHLARVAARRSEDPLALEGLAIEDLYLTCACMAALPGAAEAFEARCGERLRATVAGATKSADERREMEQRLRGLLLVGDEHAPPKIQTYGGQGPLDRWVAVVAQRQVVTGIRSEQAERRAREGAALEAAAVAIELDPEVAFLKERYRTEFERAMAAALGTLNERERMLLRLRLVSGLGVGQIGQMYGVSQSSASRWLAEAQEKVADEVTRLMRETANLSATEMRSLAGLVASQLNLSMSRILKAG